MVHKVGGGVTLSGGMMFTHATIDIFWHLSLFAPFLIALFEIRNRNWVGVMTFAWVVMGYAIAHGAWFLWGFYQMQANWKAESHAARQGQKPQEILLPHRPLNYKVMSRAVRMTLWGLAAAYFYRFYKDDYTGTWPANEVERYNNIMWSIVLTAVISGYRFATLYFAYLVRPVWMSWFRFNLELVDIAITVDDGEVQYV